MIHFGTYLEFFSNSFTNFQNRMLSLFGLDEQNSSISLACRAQLLWLHYSSNCSRDRSIPPRQSLAELQASLAGEAWHSTSGGASFALRSRDSAFGSGIHESLPSVRRGVPMPDLTSSRILPSVALRRPRRSVLAWPCTWVALPGALEGSWLMAKELRSWTPRSSSG